MALPAGAPGSELTRYLILADAVFREHSLQLLYRLPESEQFLVAWHWTGRNEIANRLPVTRDRNRDRRVEELREALTKFAHAYPNELA
jgi:hypothetical protein